MNKITIRNIANTKDFQDTKNPKNVKNSKNTNITTQINEYLDYCKNIRQMSDITIRNKRTTLLKFARTTKINSAQAINNHIYNSWVKQKLASHVASTSLNIYASTIHNFIKFHQNNGVKIDFNFNNIPHFKSIKTSRKFYTPAEIEQVLSHAGEVEELMVKIMHETGMRIAELTSLKVDNLNQTKITFIGKGAKPREVYISTSTAETLQDFLQKYQIQDGSLWQVVNGAKTKNHEPPTVATIRKNLQKTFGRAGFDGFYPHALRHSFATNLQKKGATIAEIKEMMGHSNIATTERYLHGFDGRLEELFNKYR